MNAQISGDIPYAGTLGSLFNGDGKMNENAIETIEMLCNWRKDKRYRAGVIDVLRHFDKITQRQWLDLRVKYTDFKKYAKHDHYLKSRGE